MAPASSLTYLSCRIPCQNLRSLNASPSSLIYSSSLLFADFCFVASNFPRSQLRKTCPLMGPSCNNLGIEFPLSIINPCHEEELNAANRRFRSRNGQMSTKSFVQEIAFLPSESVNLRLILCNVSSFLPFSGECMFCRANQPAPYRDISEARNAWTRKVPKSLNKPGYLWRVSGKCRESVLDCS